METIALQKAALRRQVRQRCRTLTVQERLRSDKALFSRFLALPQTAQAETILLYHGMGTEPDTAQLIQPLLDAGHAVALPRCLPGNRLETRLIQSDTKLVRHPLGMLEPDTACPLIAAANVDLTLVPGLAFDPCGGRLGQGGGYYDRWLTGFSGITVALCRDVLLFPNIPQELHDQAVKIVLTETESYSLSC